MSSDRDDLLDNITSEDIEDELVNLLMIHEDQDIFKLDDITDEINDRFLKSIEKTTDNKAEDQYTDQNGNNQLSDSKTIETDDIKLIDEQAFQNKEDITEKKSKLNSEKKILDNDGIEFDSEQLLDSFDDVFEPIHTDDLLLPEITPLAVNNADNTKLVKNKRILSSERCTLSKEEVINPYHNSKYIDYAKISDEEAMAMTNNKGKRRKTLQAFPQKMYLIVERSEVDGYSDIVSWLPHGRAFKIHNTPLFLKTILPKFFYQTKMSSFIRQLSTYGFQRFSSSKHDKGAYFHELFLRGRSELCKAISRQEKRAIVDPANEPNLSHYDSIPLSYLPMKVESSPASLASTDNDCVDRDRAPVIRYADKNANELFPQNNNNATNLNLSTKKSQKRDGMVILSKIAANVRPCIDPYLLNYNRIMHQKLLAQMKMNYNCSQNNNLHSSERPRILVKGTKKLVSTLKSKVNISC